MCGGITGRLHMRQPEPESASLEVVLKHKVDRLWRRHREHASLKERLALACGRSGVQELLQQDWHHCVEDLHSARL